MFLYFLPQWMYEIEHTFSGYLYISGQLLTALANCYFFIIGVHHFHLFKIRVLVSHKSSMIYAKKMDLNLQIIDMRRKRPKMQTLLIDGYYEILL